MRCGADVHVSSSAPGCGGVAERSGVASYCIFLVQGLAS